MNEDAITNLIVHGGAEFVRTLTVAADAQDKLTNSIKNASTAGTDKLNSSIQTLATGLDRSTKQAAAFTAGLEVAVKQMGLSEEVANKVTSAIERQSKAFLANAATIKATTEAKERLGLTRSTNFNNNVAGMPQGVQTGVTADFIAGPRNFGRVSNFSPEAQMTALRKSLETQQTEFLRSEETKRNAMRDSIEERALIASKARIVRRVLAEREASEQIRVAKLRESEQIRSEANAQSKFASAHPEFVAKTATVKRVDVDPGINATTNALKLQGGELDKTTQKGYSYLTSLSAIHAASFLATGQTFSLLGSTVTLGTALSKLAPEGSKLGLAFGAAGIGIAGVLSGFHFLTTSVGTVIDIVEQGAQTVLKFGAAATVGFGVAVLAAGKLASGVEDVVAEIAAFGEPTVEQFLQIEAGISKVARKFGTSATQVSQGASLYIRAGGEINDSITEAVDAVTKLTIASRGELIPSGAARAIVTVTNTFKEFKNNAEGVVDIIVGLAQKTALSFSEVTQALQQAAPTASLLKIPLLDLSAVIGVLANNGLRGQVAGTGFKQVLLDLLNPSEKAKAKLQELGISIQDSNGKVRPLIDIFGDFKRALGDLEGAEGKTADASKAQALAIIFGSRANLAAAIIARTGAEAFREMRDAIGAVSANDVIEILLSTTSAQVNILKTNIEELARAFGGPLNVAVGSALKTVNGFVGGIDRKNFELAGQAIIAVFTGGGFQKVHDAIAEIPDERVQEFLKELLNSALTIRNAFVNELIPAFQQAGTNISNAFATVDIAEKFQGITGTIAGLISSGSRLVIFVSELMASFITGDARGQEIRKTLNDIATVIKGALTAAFISVVTPIIVGIKTIELFSFALSKLVDIASSADTAFKRLENRELVVQTNSLNSSLSNTSTELANVKNQITGLRAEQEKLVGPRVAPAFQGPSSQDLRNAIQNGTELPPSATPIANELPSRAAMDRAFQINDEILALTRRADSLAQSETELAAAAGKANKALSEVTNASNPWQQIQQDIKNVKFDNIDQFLDGDLPAGMTALANKLTEVQAIMDKGGAAVDREPTDAAFTDDPNKTRTAQNEITQIIKTNGEERQDIITDLERKEVDLRNQTLNRLIDMATKFNTDIIKIDKDRDKRIADSERDFAQRRSDRDELQVIQRGFEDEAQKREQANAKRDQLNSQAEAAEDKSNQRIFQDRDKSLSLLQDREQHSQDIIDQIRDRGTQRQLQDAERAFGKKQNAEETSFSRSLQNQATARDNAQKLAAAKTPEERSNLIKQFKDSQENTTFQRGQEEQLRAFRERQETARVSFQRQQEDSQFANSIKNEKAQFDFRVALEKKYLGLRRQLEDEDTTRQNGVEVQRLLNRLGLQTEDFNFRRGQQDKLQTEQDRLADDEHERTIQQIKDDAEERKTERREQFSQDVFGLFADSRDQSQKNQESAIARLRDLDQRAARQLGAIKDRQPSVGGIVQTALLTMERELIVTDLLLKNTTADAQDFLDTVRQAVLIGQGVPTEAPRRQLNVAIPDFTPEQNGIINQNHTLDISPFLMDLLPKAIAAGFDMADIQTEGDRIVTIQGDVFNNDQMRLLLQNLLYNTRR